MKIDYLDLSREWKAIEKVVQPFINEFLKSGNYIEEALAALFEYNFCKYTETDYAVAYSNGADALNTCLQALNLKGSTHVVIPANAHISIALAVKQQQGLWSFELIDHDEYYQIDVSLLKKYVAKVRNNYDNLVIIPVHTYGHTADMKNIMKIAKSYDCLVIEEASQAHGAFTTDGKMVGQYGDICVYSCNSERNLAATSNVAIITTNKKKYSKNLKALRAFGTLQKYEQGMIELNNSLDGVQAIILQEKLKFLNYWNRQRQNISAIYNEQLKDIPQIKIPEVADYSHIPVYNVYCIQANNRDKLKSYLKKQGISTAIHYLTPIKSAKCNEGINLKNYCPNTYMNKNVILSLPIHSSMTKEMVYYICHHIKQFYNSNGKTKI